MAEWSEKCLTCQKSSSIVRWGWYWSCDEPECHYQPVEPPQYTESSASIRLDGDGDGKI